MNAPDSLSKQRIARCRGELHRGSGIWPRGWSNGHLEPPFEPFNWSNITRWDLGVNGFNAPYQEHGWLRRLLCPVPLPSDEQYRSGEPPGRRTFFIITISHYADDEITYAKAEQLLLALGTARDPVCFELFGIGPSSHQSAGQPRIETRFVCSQCDVALLEAQLHSLYPRSSVITHEFDIYGPDMEWMDRIRGGDDPEDPLFVAPLYLTGPYFDCILRLTDCNSFGSKPFLKALF